MIDITIAPMVGFYPHSHMGHAFDIGRAMDLHEGVKIVGISNKPSVFTFEERLEIVRRQFYMAGIRYIPTFVPVSSMGETIKIAAASLFAADRERPSRLTLIYGADRERDAERFRAAILNGNIPEASVLNVKQVNISYTTGTGRAMGFSGTEMRTAAVNGQFEKYWAHLGHWASFEKANEYHDRIVQAYDRGEMILSRKN